MGRESWSGNRPKGFFPNVLNPFNPEVHPLGCGTSQKINRNLDLKGLSYTADDVIEEFQRYQDEYSLFNHMEKIIIKQNSKIRTSETYTSALNSFKKFRKNEDIMLDCITNEVIEEYEAWLKGNGLIPNSISFYTRILRAVYNRAIDDEIIENRNPFR